MPQVIQIPIVAFTLSLSAITLKNKVKLSKKKMLKVMLEYQLKQNAEQQGLKIDRVANDFDFDAFFDSIVEL